MRLYLCLPALALAVSTVHAQPAAVPSAEADALFDQARALLGAGKLAEACTAFDGSQKLAPAISTVLNQADCREKNGQLATAYGHWRDAERQTRAPLDDATQKLNRLALDRAKALEPRLSKLAIELPTGHRVTGLEVTRNGEPIDPSALGRPLPIDGGTYTITARAADHEPFTATVTLAAEADFKTVTIPRLAPKARPVAVRSKVVPLVVGGVAVALIGTAIGSELSARASYRESQREPDDFRQESLWQSARTKRYFAQGLALTGVAAAGVAVWLYVRDRKTERRAPGVAIEPLLGAGHAGLSFTGRY